LRERLRRLIEQPDLHAALAQRGRRRVLEQYTQRALAEAYLAIYQGMLS
jgi:glycosyltransferase involved in cell wall biosynthesis